MPAVVAERAGGPEVLAVRSRPIPTPGAGQVLIRVDYAGVNPHDCNQRRRGHGPAGETDILGLEVSGRISAVGSAVEAGRVGEVVCALVPGGGYATHCVADARLALACPAGLTVVEAAAVPETFFTAWLNLVELGHVADGDWVLLHGGTGNVAMAATAIAIRLGAQVITTVGSEEKADISRGLGARDCILYRREDVAERVMQLTGGHGADIILDTTGKYAQANLACLAMDGRIMHVSSGDGSFQPPLGLMLQKRASLIGSGLRPLPVARKQRIAAGLRERIWPLLGAGVTPRIDRVFPLGEAGAAQARVESGAALGKVLLDCTQAGAEGVA